MRTLRPAPTLVGTRPDAGIALRETARRAREAWFPLAMGCLLVLSATLVVAGIVALRAVLFWPDR